MYPSLWLILEIAVIPEKDPEPVSSCSPSLQAPPASFGDHLSLCRSCRFPGPESAVYSRPSKAHLVFQPCCFLDPRSLNPECHQCAAVLSCLPVTTSHPFCISPALPCSARWSQLCTSAAHCCVACGKDLVIKSRNVKKLNNVTALWMLCQAGSLQTKLE